MISIDGKDLEFAPGDEMTLTIVHLGRDPGQGVAYTRSGLKVFVRDGAPFLSQSCPLTIERVLIGDRDLVFFARLRGLPSDIRPPDGDQLETREE